jgi:hypothetical protein
MEYCSKKDSFAIVFKLCFEEIFAKGQTGRSVSSRDSRLSALSADRRLLNIYSRPVSGGERWLGSISHYMLKMMIKMYFGWCICDSIVSMETFSRVCNCFELLITIFDKNSRFRVYSLISFAGLGPQASQ